MNKKYKSKYLPSESVNKLRLVSYDKYPDSIFNGWQLGLERFIEESIKQKPDFDVKPSESSIRELYAKYNNLIKDSHNKNIVQIFRYERLWLKHNFPAIKKRLEKDDLNIDIYIGLIKNDKELRTEFRKSSIQNKIKKLQHKVTIIELGIVPLISGTFGDKYSVIESLPTYDYSDNSGELFYFTFEGVNLLNAATKYVKQYRNDL